MVDLGMNDYPHSNNEARKKTHRAMSKLANPKHLQEEISFEEFSRKINGK